MRHFTFTLESIRKLRDHAERRAREEMARELGARERQASEVARSADALGDAHDGARSADPAARAMWSALIERRKLEQARAERALVEQEERLGKSRARATDAAREHEMITRLERRRRVEHARAGEKAEDAELSELATTAFRRGRGAS